MRINTNVSAINAYNNLSKVQDSLSSSMAKLSSGFRINKAGDDAAGLGIANQLRGDIGAMQQASNNADQSMSVLQIMDGATQNIESILDRMKSLAAQSASDTVDSTARTKIDNEFNSLSDELDRIVNTTKFQGANLLDGTYGSKVTAGGSIDATATGSLTGAAHVASATVGDAAKLKTINGAITASIVTTNATVGTSSATGVTASMLSGDQAKLDALDASQALTVSVNSTPTASTIESGFTADAKVTSAAADATVTAGDHVFTAVANSGDPTQVDITIDGGSAITVDPTGSNFTAGGFTFNTSGAATADVVSALNGKTLNVSQTYDVTMTGGGVSGGETVSVKDTGASTGTQNIDFSASYGIRLAVDLTAGSVTGAAGTVGLTGGTSSVKLDGTDASGNAVTQSVALNANPASQALDFSSKFGVTITLAAGATSANLTTEFGTTNKIVQAQTHQAQYLVSASQSYTTNDLVSLDAVSLSATSLGVGKSTVDLTSASGAQAALTAIDGAITKVGTALGAIGAAENRITYASSNVKTAIENFSAAESTIRDVDMAQEMTNFSKNQILSQAGTAMLAQANQLGSSVLKLLQ